MARKLKKTNALLVNAKVVNKVFLLPIQQETPKNQQTMLSHTCSKNTETFQMAPTQLTPSHQFLCLSDSILESISARFSGADSPTRNYQRQTSVATQQAKGYWPSWFDDSCKCFMQKWHNYGQNQIASHTVATR